MKIANSIIVALALGVAAITPAYSETVYQSVPGEDAVSPDGGKALDKKLIEVKSIPDNGNVARLLGSMVQWGYVNFWFGLSVPAGKVIIRFKVYVDDGATADYCAYIRTKDGQTNVGKLEIPATAAKNSFVVVDLPVEEQEEWNGLSLKKIDTSDKPSPWIGSVSIIQP